MPNYVNFPIFEVEIWFPDLEGLKSISCFTKKEAFHWTWTMTGTVGSHPVMVSSEAHISLCDHRLKRAGWEGICDRSQEGTSLVALSIWLHSLVSVAYIRMSPECLKSSSWPWLCFIVLLCFLRFQVVSGQITRILKALGVDSLPNNHHFPTGGKFAQVVSRCAPSSYVWSYNPYKWAF